MSQITCDTIETMLESVEEEVDDPDLVYKLRTARQLLLVCKYQNETLQDSLQEADLDDDIRQRLVGLGYL